MPIKNVDLSHVAGRRGPRLTTAQFLVGFGAVTRVLYRLTKRVRRQEEAGRMAWKAVARRQQRLGWDALLKRIIPLGVRVVYIDLGLYKRAEQMRLVADWFQTRCELHLYGFEAHPGYLECARKALANTRGVSLVNAAVVGPQHGPVVRLYHDGCDGRGDSIIRRSDTSFEVPAVRLSYFLSHEGFDPSRDVMILRMNIEGAETYVLEDLLAAGLISSMDGYYGAWDDPHKIGGKTARRFDEVMELTGVENFRFNDKDCKSRLRRAIIRYDLTTSIVAGARAKRFRSAI